MMRRTCNLLDCKIDRLTMEQTIKLVEKKIADETPCQHVVLNVAKLIAMRTNPKLRDIVNRCDIVNADGMPIVWASKILGDPLPCRVTGIDLFYRLVAVSAEKKYRVFFFGAQEEVVKKVVEIFKRKYPTLDVAGFRNGYFSKKEEPAIAKMIYDSRAQILFVGFPSPMKEEYLDRWRNVMNVPFCMGVGGSFDIVAEVTKRAPLWMQKCGLEWFFRLIQEPRRMWKRYFTTNPVFMSLVLKQYIKQLG